MRNLLRTRKEKENGAEDGLNGGKHYEPSERNIQLSNEIAAEAEDVQWIRGGPGLPHTSMHRSTKGHAPLAPIVKLAFTAFQAAYEGSIPFARSIDRSGVNRSYPRIAPRIGRSKPLLLR
jgi:hypothetical protein